MKNILFPTEFATHAPQMFQFALAIADVFKAKIYMLNALNLELYPKDNTNFEDEAAKTMDKLVEFKEFHQQKEMAHISVEYITEIGFAADVILKVAERDMMDLIIMGTQGNTIANEIYLGGAAVSVMGQATCPVLLIPPSAEFRGFHKMVCTTNFDFQDLIVFATLKKWAKKFKAKIEALHVIEDRDDLPAIRKKLDLLRDLFDNQIQFQLQSGNVTEMIEEFVEFTKPDILAMVHHQHNFISRLINGDVTEEIAREVRLPLLIFNEI